MDDHRPPRAYQWTPPFPTSLTSNHRLPPGTAHLPSLGSRRTRSRTPPATREPAQTTRRRPRPLQRRPQHFRFSWYLPGTVLLLRRPSASVPRHTSCCRPARALTVSEVPPSWLLRPYGSRVRVFSGNMAAPVVHLYQGRRHVVGRPGPYSHYLYGR